MYVKLREGDWLVVSKIFYFHPYLGKIPILTNIFQLGWNHQLGDLLTCRLSTVALQQKSLGSNFQGSKASILAVNRMASGTLPPDKEVLVECGAFFFGGGVLQVEKNRAYSPILILRNP